MSGADTGGNISDIQSTSEKGNSHEQVTYHFPEYEVTQPIEPPNLLQQILQRETYLSEVLILIAFFVSIVVFSFVIYFFKRRHDQSRRAKSYLDSPAEAEEQDDKDDTWLGCRIKRVLSGVDWLQMFEHPPQRDHLMHL